MDKMHAMRVAELQARVVAGQLAMQTARDDLIERLGDHLCGGTGGRPTWSDLRALAKARRRTSQAQRELAQFVAFSTLSAIGRRSASRSVRKDRPG